MPEPPVPITVTSLFAYEGPNIFSPHAGVLLRLRCAATPEAASTYPAYIKDALKAGAQFIGMVMAYLDVTTTTPAAPSDTLTISATFTTPTPAIGTLLASHVVETLHAQETGDDEWDRDTPLFELQSYFHEQRPNITTLQLVANARARWLPTLTLPDGQVQIGYGCRGWQFNPAAWRGERASASPMPPWERLGTIPIYAITGETQRAAMVQQVADHLDAAGRTPHVLDDADYDTTLAALSNPTTENLVIGLQTPDILRRGLAFNQCTLAIVTDIEGQRPPEALDDGEWARSLGVPMLLSSGPAFLNTTFPALEALTTIVPREVFSLKTPGALSATLDQLM